MLGENMKKSTMILTFSFILLMNFSSILAISIVNCTSNDKIWECELDKTCNCIISGTCTNGNLLVYHKNITTLLCSPKINDSIASIEWENCKNPTGYVNIRADCDEGQSDQETILLFAPTTTTTTTIITTTTRRTTTTRATTTTIQIPTQRACPYECCVDEPGYRDKYCSPGLTCCPDHTCKKSCEGGLSSKIIFWVALAAIIPIVLFLLYVWKGKASENIAGF